MILMSKKSATLKSINIITFFVISFIVSFAFNERLQDSLGNAGFSMLFTLLYGSFRRLIQVFLRLKILENRFFYEFDLYIVFVLSFVVFLISNFDYSKNGFIVLFGFSIVSGINGYVSNKLAKSNRFV